NFKSTILGNALTVYINGNQEYTNSSIVPSTITQGTFGFNLYNPDNVTDTSFNATIDNLVFTALPVGVGAITISTNPVLPGNSTNTSANFIDSNTTSTHTATWDWGDGNTSSGSVTESSGSGSVTGSHTYSTAGSYTIKLTVTN